jgi:RIO-like serine/threonine protein kinase
VHHDEAEKEHEGEEMLTDTQVQVLSAVNDHCEIHGRMNVGGVPMPDLLADLGMPDAEVYTALSDLHELGLIKGVMAAESDYPIIVMGLSARGRQELP